MSPLQLCNEQVAKKTLRIYVFATLSTVAAAAAAAVVQPLPVALFGSHYLKSGRAASDKECAGA